MKFLHFLGLIAFFGFPAGIFSQSVTLKLIVLENESSTQNIEISYQKTHPNKNALFLEVEQKIDSLKKVGFISAFVQSSSTEKDRITTTVILGFKIVEIKLQLPQVLLDEAIVSQSLIHIPFTNLEAYLAGISKKLEEKGQSFAEVKLKNIKIQQNQMSAEVSVLSSKARVINSVIIKGYERFPRSFLKNVLPLEKKPLFTSKKTKELSKLISSLSFVEELKAPEALFTRDSTLLYLYLKQKEASSFDGLVNFTSKENGKGLLFNGTLDLNLVNALHSGETIRLFWNSIGNQRQEFLFHSELPYVLKTPMKLTVDFTIYKQDSSFLNTRFTAALGYSPHPNKTIYTAFETENSSIIQENSLNQIDPYSNSFISVGYTYIKPHPNNLYPTKAMLQVSTALGKRKGTTATNTQYKIALQASYTFDISERQAIFLQNTSGYLKSDTYVVNELYRIGGANSLRGFNEQSIFSPQYSFFNLEYRYITAQDSYLYTITDFGVVKNSIQETEQFLGLGAGYSFQLQKTRVNLGYVIGKSTTNDFNFNDGKLILSFRSQF